MGSSSSNSGDTQECVHPIGGICSNCAHYDTQEFTDEYHDNLEALSAAANVSPCLRNLGQLEATQVSAASARHRQLVALLFLLTLSSEEVLQEPHPLVSCCFDLPAARDAMVRVLSSHRAVWELSLTFAPAVEAAIWPNITAQESQTIALSRLEAAPDAFVHSVVSRIHAAFMLEGVPVDVLATSASSELAGLRLHPCSGRREGGTNVLISGPSVGSNESGLQLLYNQEPCADEPFKRTLHNYQVIIPHMLVSVRTPPGYGQTVIERPGIPHSAIFKYDAVQFNGHVECRCINGHLRFGDPPSTARFHWTELDFCGNWAGQLPEHATLQGVEPVEVLSTESFLPIVEVACPSWPSRYLHPSANPDIFAYERGSKTREGGVVRCLLPPMKWQPALHEGWPWFVRVRLAAFAAVTAGQFCWPVMEMLLVELADLCLLEDQRKLSANEYTKRGDRGCCSKCNAVSYWC